MRQSLLFSKTSKTFSKGEESINARFLIKAGFVSKASAGIYSYLPLGWRTLGKINQIIREEMDAIGGQELLFPAMVAKKYWIKSDRWKTPVAYKIKTGREEFALGWTHEEIASHLADEFIKSEKDLPRSVYQIQTKFRQEPRARGGLIRLREFMMKDLYSFHKSEEELNKFYWKVGSAYKKVFKRLSLPIKVVEASGGEFTKEFTHEFQVLTDGGEDTVFYCEKCGFARNKEIFKGKSGSKCPSKECSGKIKESRAVEVGNIFRLGRRFSPWWMGSYGLGSSRIMAALVEIHNDEKGIIWPSTVAPYKAHLLSLSPSIKKQADKIYHILRKRGIDVLYDDRDDISAGEKLIDADLLGMPWRLVVSGKTKDKVEVKARKSNKAKLESIANFISKFK